MESLREFFTSSSGLVPARRGLGLGWVISALTGITVLLGAKEAEAEECRRYTDSNCSYSVWCDDRSDGARPLKCCPIVYRTDCSFQTQPCYCTA